MYTEGSRIKRILGKRTCSTTTYPYSNSVCYCKQEQGHPDDIFVEARTADESCGVDTLPAFLPVEEHPIKTAFTVW